MLKQNTTFFKNLPIEIIDLIFAKLNNPKDFLLISSIDKLSNMIAFEKLFERRDRKFFDTQTTLLFLWIANNPKKLIKYCQDSAMKSKWIQMLSEGLENEDADWASQFCRLFFINSLLDGPAIAELNHSSIQEIVSSDKLNDTTNTYDTYLFYIAKLYPEEVYTIIKKADTGKKNSQTDPELMRIGRLASLYKVFPPLIQKEILDYILEVLP
ncbi:MAG: hypothetical protein WC627_06120, partial [Legionella sp.]